MPKLDADCEHGLEVLKQMAGGAFADGVRAFAETDGFGGEMGRIAVRACFAEAWGREGLDRKSKSIAIISALVAMHLSAELKNHVKIGVNHGLTVADFESLLIQLQPYVGVPTASNAMIVVMETLREIGQIKDGKSAKERGLL